MRIVLAADHAGFAMKEHIHRHLKGLGHHTEDFGARSFVPTDDYPGYMRAAVQAMSRDSDSRGILFGGSGQGEAMVANRHSGIRAIVYCCPNLDLISLGREHNDANVLSIGARFISESQAEQAVESFLALPFPGEDRHARRIRGIDGGAA